MASVLTFPFSWSACVMLAPAPGSDIPPRPVTGCTGHQEWGLMSDAGNTNNIQQPGHTAVSSFGEKHFKWYWSHIYHRRMNILRDILLISSPAWPASGSGEHAVQDADTHPDLLLYFVPLCRLLEIYPSINPKSKVPKSRPKELLGWH